MSFQIKTGDVVMSKAGRDRGRYFIVLKKEGIFAYICDGDLRKTDKPKKKKIKHLENSGKNSEYIRLKLEAGEKITNAELRRSVSEFLNSVQ